MNMAIQHQDFFYVNPEDVQKSHLILKDEEFHHAVHVHRKQINQIIWAVNGRGLAYECLVTDIKKDALVAKILNMYHNLSEPAFKLHLGFALIKGSKIDWLIEKCTEVGVSAFLPFISSRTESNVTSTKIQRWQRLTLSAMKQCGRSWKPKIEDPQHFEKLCKNFTGEVKLIAHEAEEQFSLKKYLARYNNKNVPQSGIILIGPEGGFTDQEIMLAISCGFQPISLGSRRLRSETAAVVGAALLLSEMESFIRNNS